MFKCLSPESLGLSAAANELIEPALSNGFKGLELDIVPFAALAERETLPTARRLLDSAKLKMGYFRLPLDLEAADADFKADLEKLKKYAQLASDMNCSRCVTVLAPANDQRPIHQNFEHYRQRLTATAKVLDEHGIQLGIGFSATADARADKQFEFIHKFDTMKLLLSMVSAKNVGIAVDLFELWACGSSFDAVKNAKIVAVFVSAAAAGVSQADATQAARVLPGETGTIDTAAALVALAEAGYEGPIVPRAHTDRFKQTGRATIFKTTAEKLDAAWKTAGLTPAGKLVAVKR